MIYLLDTHILLQLLMKPEKLSKRIMEVVSSTQNICLISAVCFWEISLKYALGKLELKGIDPSAIPEKCKEMGFDIIPISYKEASSYHQLSAIHHKDPFDRMLIWQAIKNNYVLISDDEVIKKYAGNGLKFLGSK